MSLIAAAPTLFRPQDGLPARQVDQWLKTQSAIAEYGARDELAAARGILSALLFGLAGWGAVAVTCRFLFS